MTQYNLVTKHISIEYFTLFYLNKQIKQYSAVNNVNKDLILEFNHVWIHFECQSLFFLKRFIGWISFYKLHLMEKDKSCVFDVTDCIGSVSYVRFLFIYNERKYLFNYFL